MTLKEYANLKNISLVTLNNRIKKGLINSIKEGNRRYVVYDGEDLDSLSKDINKYSLDNHSEDILKEYKLLNKSLERQNKKLYKLINKKDLRIVELENDIKELNNTKNNLLLDYVSEMKNIYLPVSASNNKEDEIIEAEPIKKKKKNKSKKGGKTK